MKVEILGAHNTETDRARLPCLLVDDVIALDAGGLTSALPLERQHKVKAVLLTHHHFDHTRDLIMLGANDTVPPSTVDVYGLPATLEVVYMYLLDGKMYKDYTAWPSREAPRLRLKPLAPYQPFLIEGLTVTTVPVSHSVPAVGFLVSGPGGKSIFYAGDSGSGLSECWQRISPDVLFIEVTRTNDTGDEMYRLRHLTPQFLADELEQFKQMKGYLPRVIATHLHVALEKEIMRELDAVSLQLKVEIELGYEGMLVEV